MNKYNDTVMKAIRERMGLDENNTSFAGKMKFSLDNAGLTGWEVREFHIDNDGTKVC